jgi:hypothetical protein
MLCQISCERFWTEHIVYNFKDNFIGYVAVFRAALL